MEKDIFSYELIAEANEHGFRVTKNQLARWHRSGLLPAPYQRHLGRGKGTASVYPVVTRDQLLQLLRARQTERRLRYIGWRLWWDGYAVNPALVRGVLDEVVLEFEDAHGVLFDSDSDGLSQSAMDFLDQSDNIRLPPLITEIRKRVGGYFPVVLETILLMMGGRMESLPIDPKTGTSEPFVKMLEKGLGLDRARTDRLDGSPLWVMDTPQEVVQSIVALAPYVAIQSWRQVLSEATIDDLNEVRIWFRDFTNVVLTVVPVVDLLYGKDSSGFGWFSRALKYLNSKPALQAQAVFLLLLIGQIDELKVGLRAIGVAVRKTNERLVRVAEVQESG